jgi:hypothetical protein
MYALMMGQLQEGTVGRQLWHPNTNKNKIQMKMQGQKKRKRGRKWQVEKKRKRQREVSGLTAKMDTTIISIKPQEQPIKPKSHMASNIDK